ncbi:hypothetical protein [Altibacter sp.]|nr:hypothetical protein [Altibacter sp.]|tara:strand:- start:7908 stop:8033 length:126 start_codon:yes stop_codon:yes gene_type:complete
MSRDELIELLQFVIKALEAMEDDCKIDQYQQTLDTLRGEDE